MGCGYDIIMISSNLVLSVLDKGQLLLSNVHVTVHVTYSDWFCPRGFGHMTLMTGLYWSVE